MLEDIDFKTKKATVREKGKGGKGKARTVYMSPRTAWAIQPARFSAWLGVRGVGRFAWGRLGLGSRPDGKYDASDSTILRALG